jgi:CRISPR/Cas system-associated protein endoribonuclease Cas2
MTMLSTQTREGGPTHLSAYRQMWLLMTFDLPVETKKQRKAAHDFRVYLLDLGFEMSQLPTIFASATKRKSSIPIYREQSTSPRRRVRVSVHRPAI